MPAPQSPGSAQSIRPPRPTLSSIPTRKLALKFDETRLTATWEFSRGSPQRFGQPLPESKSIPTNLTAPLLRRPHLHVVKSSEA